MKYTYEVIGTDLANKVMEVKYSTEGHAAIHVGMPLPLIGEKLEQQIQRYAPLNIWVQERREVQNISVGQKGTIDAFAVQDPQMRTSPQMGSTASSQNLQNLDMWNEIAFERKVMKVLLRTGIIDKDPSTIEVTKL